MTEDEAKTKWCPFVRAVLPGTTLPAGNRGVGPDGTEGVKGARCIASACMAWRWTTKGGDVVKADIKQLRKPPGEVNPPFSNTPEGYTVRGHDSWGYFSVRRDEVVGHEPGQGYCGLAGSPS